ncbi:serine/threonine-protein kinase Chk2 [Pimephales promelas]|uniref:serine/threonine-protein kinase Chk2 n=1 Tax=Pimephales promelas TaxID=90988 RepID=UPI0019554E0B|nr:serine/threonine-protein kinase Chk2 [Pimephales promelas]
MSDEPGPSGQSQSQSQSQTQSQPGSSSSSAPTSSSQGSSSGSGTLSSVDTLPVQELQSIPEDQEEAQPHVWGRIIPLVHGFSVLNCTENQYTFGRDSRCDYAFLNSIIKKSARYKTYSKKQFRIFKDDSLVYLEDLSGNGTWVDDEKLGQGKQRVLSNNSVIALAEQKHQVFMFIDKMGNDQPNLPLEFSRKYHIARKIGIGVCGEVKLAIEKDTCKKVALKTINKNDFPSIGTATRNAEREIEILKKIDHPCLIKTEDFYQTEDSYYIVLEYIEGGELFGRIKAKKQLEEDIAKLYFYQMLRAVEYLHNNGIIHRDLKPENVLLASHDDVCLIKITDFNQSKILEESSLMKTLCGTPTYLAPEVFTHAATVGYTKAVDYWSLGVLLFICLGGYPPFNTEGSTMSVREQIINGLYRFIPSQWKNVSNEAKDLVKKLLVVDPQKRLSVEEALEHPWLNDGEMRNTANQLMNPENQPMNPENQPMGPENQPMGPENQPMGPENQPMGPENQPMNPENLPMDPENRPMNPENQPMNPENRQTRSATSKKRKTDEGEGEPSSKRKPGP